MGLFQEEGATPAWYEEEQEHRKRHWMIEVERGEAARAILDEYWPGWDEEDEE